MKLSDNNTPYWFTLLGWWVLPGLLLLVGRLFYEQTIMTWHSPAQSISESLLHNGSPIYWIGVVFVLLTLVWFVCAFIFILQGRQKLVTFHWIQFILLILAILIYVPSGSWQTFRVSLWGPGEHGDKLLLLAATQGDARLATMLLQHDIDINRRNHRGETALTLAITQNRLKFVDLLLNNGANVNLRNDISGVTPLMYAAKLGNIDIVHLLLKHHANPSLKDNEGRLAEYFAFINNHPDIVKLFKQRANNPS